MTILRYTYFVYNDEYGAPVPLSRAPQAVCVDEVKKYSPVMYVTTGQGNVTGSKFFSARYYFDSPDVTKAQLDEILKGAEYAGEIKRVESRNMNVISSSESNFLPVGTEIYTLGNEAIAVLPEPHLHEESGRYIVAMKLFVSGSHINYADTVKLINGKADDSSEFVVLPESRKNEEDNPADQPAEPVTDHQTMTAKAQDDIPESEPQSKATEDISTADNLSADSVITLPGGKTIKISDIERVVLYTNNPNEPDPEVANTDSIIKILSALSKMELGEPEAGGWVGGNTIVIYSGGERFSQIAISDDEIYLVDSMDDNTKGVYPVISGGLSYDEWKALFADNE